MTEPPSPVVDGHTPPIAAATIVMLRDGPTGPEVLMLRRHESLNAFGGLWVFPGGKVEPADRAYAAWLQAASERPTGADLFAAEVACLLPVDGQSSGITAIRETFEETGILYAAAMTPAVMARFARHREDWRVAVARDAAAFEALLAAEQIQPDLAALHYWVRMLPPPDVPRRFDTDFFLARAPAGQEPLIDLNESIEARWVPYAGSEAETIDCAPVTRVVLLELRLRHQQYGSIEPFLRAARQTPCRLLVTRRQRLDGVMTVFFPWDPDYARVDGEGEPWSAADCDVMQGVPGRLPIQDGLFSTKTPTAR